VWPDDDDDNTIGVRQLLSEGNGRWGLQDYGPRCKRFFVRTIESITEQARRS
jgi:hypothetical protein